MAPRKGIRRGLGHRKKSRDRLEELTERTRREARAMSRQRRAEARRTASTMIKSSIKFEAGATVELDLRQRPSSPGLALLSAVRCSS